MTEKPDEKKESDGEPELIESLQQDLELKEEEARDVTGGKGRFFDVEPK